MPKTVYRKAKPAKLCAVCREPSTRTCHLCTRPTCDAHPNCGRHAVDTIDEVRDVEIGATGGKLVSRCSQCPRRATRSCEDCGAPICSRHEHCADGEQPIEATARPPVVALATRRAPDKPAIRQVVGRDSNEATRVIEISDPGGLADRLAAIATGHGAVEIEFKNNRWSWSAGRVDMSVTLAGDNAVIQARSRDGSSMVPAAATVGIAGLFFGPVGIAIGSLWAVGCLALGARGIDKAKEDRRNLSALADGVVAQLVDS